MSTIQILGIVGIVLSDLAILHVIIKMFSKFESSVRWEAKPYLD